MKDRLPLFALGASLLLHLAAGFFHLPAQEPVKEEEQPVLIRIAELPPASPEPVPEPKPEPPPPEPVLKPEAEPLPEEPDPEPPTPPVSVEKTISTPTDAAPVADPKAIELYAALIRKQIVEKKRYPTPSRRREEEGIVLVRFSLDRRGNLVGEPQLETPCRYSRLNKAALEAVIDAAPYPRPLEGMESTELSFQVPIRFSLRH
jgi:periplasmic protein TonB